jgi:hypothetical protein
MLMPLRYTIYNPLYVKANENQWSILFYILLSLDGVSTDGFSIGDEICWTV